MEKNEPLCNGKVPREGICIRKDDGKPECWKLKCLSFLNAESKLVDEGNVDIEMAEAYGDDDTAQ